MQSSQSSQGHRQQTTRYTALDSVPSTEPSVQERGLAEKLGRPQLTPSRGPPDKQGIPQGSDISQ